MSLDLNSLRFEPILFFVYYKYTQMSYRHSLFQNYRNPTAPVTAISIATKTAIRNASLIPSEVSSPMKPTTVENAPTATMNFLATSLLITHLPTLLHAIIFYCVDGLLVAPLSFNFNDSAIVAIVIVIWNKSKMSLFLLVHPGFFTIVLLRRVISSPSLLRSEDNDCIFCPLISYRRRKTAAYFSSNWDNMLF